MFIGYQEKIIGYETKYAENGLGEKEQIQVPIKEEFIAFAAPTKEEVEQAPCMEFTRIEEVEKEYVLFGGKWLPKEEAEHLLSVTQSQNAVRALESKTGLTRAVRELVLAEGSGASDYVKQQAQEIEALAAPLREETKNEPV